jgi:hypothetical protein
MTHVAGTLFDSDSASRDIDRRQAHRQTLLLLVTATMARIPFLWHGFGGHPDEWLVVRSGLDFWLHDVYFPSRPIGYPLNDILMGGLAWLGGATACAAASLVASLITLAYMRGLAPLYGIRDSFWMVLAFSFEPWVWSSGTHGLDYIWGTGALVATLYYVEHRRFAAGGLSGALGFGFRWSSPVWIGPVFIRVLLIRRNWQQVWRFVVWSVVPSLAVLAMIVWPFRIRPDLLTVRPAFNPVTALALALFHCVELLGFPPALLIAAACFHYRRKFAAPFRFGESWAWIFVFMFGCLFIPFAIDSGKTEYMLPALPGLFMILGRCLSNGWWKVITVAFVVSAFVSFGFGHASSREGGEVRLAMPSLRSGPVLWYTLRAKDSNDAVLRLAAGLSRRSAVVRAPSDRLDEFYVSSLLKRGMPAQARIGCPLLPARLAFPRGGSIEISRSDGLPKPPPNYWPILICCKSASTVVLASTPTADANDLTSAVNDFCRSEAATSPHAASATAPDGSRYAARRG